MNFTEIEEFEKRNGSVVVGGTDCDYLAFTPAVEDISQDGVKTPSTDVHVALHTECDITDMIVEENELRRLQKWLNGYLGAIPQKSKFDEIAKQFEVDPIDWIFRIENLIDVSITALEGHPEYDSKCSPLMGIAEALKVSKEMLNDETSGWVMELFSLIRDIRG